MNSNKYKIRLYGQSSKDPWQFCNNLASVLGVDKESARNLLANAPVVIMDNLERARGEALLETIRFLGGMCLLEPMKENSATEDVFAAFSPEMFGAKSDHDYFGASSSISSIGRLAAVSLGIAFIFMISAMLIPSHTRTNIGGLRVIASPVESHAKMEDSQQNKALDQLWDTYEDLEAHTDYLRDEFKRTKRALQEAQSQYPYPDQNLLREKKRSAMIAKEELDYNLRRLKRLARKIQSMEFMENLVAERRVGESQTAWNTDI